MDLPVYKYAVGPLQETCATDRPALPEENMESVRVESIRPDCATMDVSYQDGRTGPVSFLNDRARRQIWRSRCTETDDVQVESSSTLSCSINR